jgi:hypothetical protein
LFGKPLGVVVKLPNMVQLLKANRFPSTIFRKDERSVGHIEICREVLILWKIDVRLPHRKATRSEFGLEPICDRVPREQLDRLTCLASYPADEIDCDDAVLRGDFFRGSCGKSGDVIPRRGDCGAEASRNRRTGRPKHPCGEYGNADGDEREESPFHDDLRGHFDTPIAESCFSILSLGVTTPSKRPANFPVASKKRSVGIMETPYRSATAVSLFIITTCSTTLSP